MDTIKVVCGIIFDGDKIFICRRNAGKELSGFWEFPGGKIEVNESTKDALSRELFEELGMRVDVQEYFTTVIHSYTSFVIELKAIKCKFIEASFIMTDHDSYKWVEIHDLLNWKLASADIPVAKELIKGITSI